MPEPIAHAFPFPRVGQLDNKSPAQISDMNLLPPFHGRCRCDIEFVSLRAAGASGEEIERDHLYGNMTEAERTTSVYEDFKNAGLPITESRAEEIADSIHKYTSNEYISDFHNIQVGRQTERSAASLNSHMRNITDWSMVAPRFPDDKLLFRGLKGQRDFFENMEVGSIWEPNVVSSASSNANRAQEFLKNSQTDVLVVLDRGKRKASSIAHFSKYPLEEEVLLSPKSRYTIVSKDTVKHNFQTFDRVTVRELPIAKPVSKPQLTMDPTNPYSRIVGKNPKRIDISSYPKDAKDLTPEMLAAQTQLSDTVALIRDDLAEIAVGKAEYVSIRTGILDRAAISTMRTNMLSEAKLYRHYIEGGPYDQLRDYIDDYAVQVAKVRDEATMIGRRLDPERLNKMGVDNIRKLVMQEVESNRQQFTDHGIRHLVGNIERQKAILNQLAKQGLPVTEMDRFQGSFIMINHDVGYTTPIIRKGGLRGVMTSGKHKDFSAEILSEQKSVWDVGKVFTESEFKRILHIVRTHDAPDMSLDDALAFATRLSDNTSLWWKEKLPSMFRYVDGSESILVRMGAAASKKDMKLFEELREQMYKRIDDTKRFSTQLKRDLKMAVKEMSHVTPKFSIGVLGGDISDIYSTAKSMIVMDVKHSRWDQFLSKYFDMGQKQIKKLMDDMGGKFDGNVMTLGTYKGKNIFEVRVLGSPVTKLNDRVRVAIGDGADRLIGQYAKSKGIPLETAIKRVEEGMAKLLENQDIWVRAKSEGFAGILKDKRFKTQFESGRSGGMFSPGHRKFIEDIIIGDRPENVINRPVYGYLTSSVDGYGAEQYGSIAIKLKPKTRSFSTFTLGDSLDANHPLILIADLAERGGQDITHMLSNLNTIASPIDDPKWYTMLGGNDSVSASMIIDMLYHQSASAARIRRRLGGGYIEAQIHGGVTIEDIEEVVFDKRSLYNKYKAALKALGIAARSIV